LILASFGLYIGRISDPVNDQVSDHVNDQFVISRKTIKNVEWQEKQ